jgi:hypothetical protein
VRASHHHITAGSSHNATLYKTLCPVLFGTAEEQLGPVGILANNVNDWLAVTFTATVTD